jgi:hypothetical protein
MLIVTKITFILEDANDLWQMKCCHNLYKNSIIQKISSIGKKVKMKAFVPISGMAHTIR